MRTIFSFSILFFLALFPSKAQSIFPLWTPDGSVKALVATGNTLYVGGSFSTLVPRSHPLFGSRAVALSASTAAANPAFPVVVRREYSQGNFVAVPDTRGGWYLGGDFDMVGGKKRASTAQISSTGSVSDWQLQTSASIVCIAATRNIVCLGGNFTLSDGKFVQIIAVDAETGQKILWSYSVDRGISSMVIKDSILYVGGSFRGIGNQQRKGLAALDIRTGAVLGWNPFEPYNLQDFTPRSLALGDSTIYVCGTSRFIDGNEQAFIAEFTLINGARTSWQPALSNLRDVFSLSLTKYGVAVSGWFWGVSDTFLALIDRSNGTVTRSLTFSNSSVRTMTSKDSILYIGGVFSAVNNIPRTNLAAIHLPSGTVTDWSPYVNSNVFCLSAVGEQIYTGGSFSICGLPTIRRKNLTALDTRTGEVLPWNPTAADTNKRNVSVNALHLTPAGLYAGGEFVTMSGKQNISVVKFDMPDGIVTDSFSSPFVSPIPLNTATPKVFSLTSVGDRLFLGGAGFVYQFDAMSGQPIYVRDTILGQPRRYLWEIRSDFVHALTIDNRTLYMGGGFVRVEITKPTNSPSATRRSIAAIHIDSLTILDWDPKIGIGGLPGTPLGGDYIDYYNPFVGKIHIQDSKVYLGGYYSTRKTGITLSSPTTAFRLSTAEETMWFPVDTTRPKPVFSNNFPYVGGSGLFFDSGVIYTASLRPMAFDTAVGAKEVWRAESNISTDVILVHNNVVYAGGSGLAAFKAYTRPLATSVARAQESLSNAPLLSVHPNPANGVAITSYLLPTPCRVRLELFDILGRSVRVCVQEAQTAGDHTTLIQTSDLPAGVYFLVLESASGKSMQRLVVGR